MIELMAVPFDAPWMVSMVLLLLGADAILGDGYGILCCTDASGK